MKLPVHYVPNFVKNPDEVFKRLSNELDWVKRGNTPRDEYYCNTFPKDYIYGVGKGQRSYAPMRWHETIVELRTQVEEATHCSFDVCFLNRYRDQRDHLGWHADDSPEMDDNRPIVIISLGVEREIWFRPLIEVPRMDEVKRTQKYGEVQKLTLGHGSSCAMYPRMQDAWQHRIPKASFICGERISLTFRGYVEQA